MPQKKSRKQLPKKGTVLKAIYGNKQFEATVIKVDLGKQKVVIECEGKVFQSLSSAAKAITGHDRNGWEFWGVERR